MPDAKNVSEEKRLRNHINIDKKRRTNRHKQSAPHFHPYYELYFMQEGRCQFYMLDTVYDVQKGDVLIISPGKYHSSSYEKFGVHDRFNVYFDLEKISPPVLTYLEFLKNDSAYAIQYHVKEENEKEICHLLDRMLILYRLDNEYGDLTLDYLFSVFLLLLSRSVENINRDNHENLFYSPVEKATKYIASHYAEQIGLEDVAQVAGFSPTYFSRKFKEVTGMSFRNYLIHIRLNESKKLLRNTNLPIQKISQLCGFTSSNYFGDVFRSVFNISPREYRRLEDEII